MYSKNKINVDWALKKCKWVQFLFLVRAKCVKCQRHKISLLLPTICQN